MKTIKKIAVAVAVALVASAASFAVDYSGDVQLQLGWQGATTKAGKNEEFGDETKYQSNAFYIAVQNWNLFNINDLFSVGFFEKIDFGIGGGNTMDVGGNDVDNDYTRYAINFLIGPAVGIRAGDIAKFQIGVGFVGGYEGIVLDADPKNLVVGNGVIGFGVDLQAKFLPRVIVSPLVGFQYAFRGMGEYDIAEQDSSNDSVTVEESFNAHSYAVYVGMSINFGRR